MSIGKVSCDGIRVANLGVGYSVSHDTARIMRNDLTFVKRSLFMLLLLRTVKDVDDTVFNSPADIIA